MALEGGPSAQHGHHPRASLGPLPTTYLLWGLGASWRAAPTPPSAMEARGWEGVCGGGDPLITWKGGGVDAKNIPNVLREHILGTAAASAQRSLEPLLWTW